MHEESSESNSLDWNTDPEWVEFIESLLPTIKAIAAKYTTDWALAEDAVQEAMVTLLHVYPEDVRSYQAYQDGEKSKDEWEATLTSYCLAVARNRVLVILHSYTTGNLYVGRTVTEASENDEGESVRTRKRIPPRYLSLNDMLEDGAQIDSSGDLSWEIIRELPDLMSED